jgi:hypothetical protein
MNSDERYEDARREAAEEKWDLDHKADEEAFYCPNDACAEVERDEDNPKLIIARNGWYARSYQTHSATRIDPAVRAVEDDECSVCGSEGEEVTSSLLKQISIKNVDQI